MDNERRNFNNMTSLDTEEGERGKKNKPKQSRGSPEFNLKLRIFITILYLCVTVLVEYLFIWKFFPELPPVTVGRARMTVSFNLSYHTDLANSSSDRYRNLSKEFVALVDQRWKNSSLADYYVLSETVLFENGSVIINFSSIFKQKDRMLPLQNLITGVLENEIFPDNISIPLDNINVSVKWKPKILSYDLARDTSSPETPTTSAATYITPANTSPLITTPSTSANSNMTLTASSARSMTETTTTTKTASATAKSISSTTSSTPITTQSVASTTNG